MFGMKKSDSGWAEQALKMQDACKSYFELIDPKNNDSSGVELQEIHAALAERGEWQKDEEWRISTHLFVSIKTDAITLENQHFRVAVECDGQILSCVCPTVERAFAFYKLYSHIIIYQFYSVGPPWAK